MGSITLKEALALSKFLERDVLFYGYDSYEKRVKEQELAGVLYQVILERIGFLGKEKGVFFEKIFSSSGDREFCFYENAYGDTGLLLQSLFGDNLDLRRVKDLACFYGYGLGTESTVYTSSGREAALDEAEDTMRDFFFDYGDDDEYESSFFEADEFRSYCDSLLRKQEFIHSASHGGDMEDDEFADDLLAEITEVYNLPDMGTACMLAGFLLRTLHSVSEEGSSMIYFTSKDMYDYHEWKLSHPDETNEIVEALDRVIRLLEAPFTVKGELDGDVHGEYMNGCYVYSLNVWGADVGDADMPMFAVAKAVFGVLLEAHTQQISGQGNS